jgi:hypothetical protein
MRQGLACDLLWGGIFEGHQPHIRLDRTRAWLGRRGPFPRQETRSGQSKVCDLGDPLRSQEHIGGLEIPMHQPLFVSVVETPGHLDRQVQNARQGTGWAFPVKGTFLTHNPVFQTSPSHIFDKNAWDACERPHEVALDNVPVLFQLDPGLRFAFKILLAPSPGKDDRQGAFHSHALPSLNNSDTGGSCDVVHLTHPALAQDAFDFVTVEDDLPNLPGVLVVGGCE